MFWCIVLFRFPNGLLGQPNILKENGISEINLTEHNFSKSRSFKNVPKKKKSTKFRDNVAITNFFKALRYFGSFKCEIEISKLQMLEICQ